MAEPTIAHLLALTYAAVDGSRRQVGVVVGIDHAAGTL